MSDKAVSNHSEERQPVILTTWTGRLAVQDFCIADEGGSMAAGSLRLAASSVEGEVGMARVFDGLGDGSEAEVVAVEAPLSTSGRDGGMMVEVQGGEIGWKKRVGGAECAEFEG